MPITDFETPESFRGRFEWSVEDDQRESSVCREAMTSLTRRVHVRRQTAYRWCKLCAALVMAVLFTQAVFYITGKSVVPYNPSQAIPGSILIDQYAHGYIDENDNTGYEHLQSERGVDVADNLYNAALHEASMGDEGKADGEISFVGVPQGEDQDQELIQNGVPEEPSQEEPQMYEPRYDQVAAPEIIEEQQPEIPQISDLQALQQIAQTPQPPPQPFQLSQQPQMPMFPGQQPVIPGQQIPFQQQQQQPMFPQQPFQQFQGQVPYQQPQQPMQPMYPGQQVQYPMQQPGYPMQQQQQQQQQQLQPQYMSQQPQQFGVQPMPYLQQPQQFLTPQPEQPLAGRPPFPQLQFVHQPSSNPPGSIDNTIGALEQGKVITQLFPDEQQLASQQIEQPASLPGLNRGPQQSNFPPMSGGFVGVSGSLNQEPPQSLAASDLSMAQGDNMPLQYQPQQPLYPDTGSEQQAQQAAYEDIGPELDSQQDQSKLLHDIGMEQPVSQLAPAVPVQEGIPAGQAYQPVQPAIQEAPLPQQPEYLGPQVNPSLDDGPDFYYGQFPNGFFWSVATSAYQIEGAWNEDGKGPSNWDKFSHIPGKVEDASTGDIACDSYHKYMEDVQMAKSLGVKHYRFSIAWSRIQPTGLETVPNLKGIEYYNNLINALLAEGIQPAVTLFHWDTPQALEDQGGWLNESLVVPAFMNYARHCFQAFGDRVKFWITLNEPFISANAGYGRGKKAPGLTGEGDLVYIAAHSLIKAHAQAYRLYQREFQGTQKGFVGITLNIVYKEAADPNNPQDVAAAERAMMFDLGWFANPIYGNGDYPEVMKTQIALKSQQQGLPRSRLPEFTEGEKKFIKGTSDFFGLNTYTTRKVQHFDQPYDRPSYSRDQDTKDAVDPSWPTSGSPWLFVNPPGIRGLLNWVKNHYGMVPIYVTENGISDRNGTLEDYHRVYYYKFYINNILKAINLDGVRVIGYTAWALMDNFEWEKGYLERFGLYHVDFNNPSRPRTPKASATFYAQLIANNGFPLPAS